MRLRLLYRSLTLLACVLGCGLFANWGIAQSVESHDGEDAIARLIEELGHPNFRVRSSAEQAIEKIGLPAFEQLRVALDHPNIQIAKSAEYLLRSQSVTWWLESDSHEVRSRLQDYSGLDVSSRLTVLSELANVAGDDAMLALCRIAKFENNELCSRAAALELLKFLNQADPTRRATLSASILLTIDRPNRLATNWLSTYCQQIQSGSQLQVKDWVAYADQLNQELAAGSQSTFRTPMRVTDLRQQQKLQVLRFYEWLVGWVREQEGREAALQAGRPSLDLVTQNQHAIHEFCTWAISVELPELIVELSDNSKALFEKENPELQYLLAEALLALGREDEANNTAAKAREIPIKKIAMMGQLARGSANEIQVSQRVHQASLLEERGLFDWAEGELQEAVKLDSRSAMRVRQLLAELYRDGKKYDQAIEVLEPIIKSPPPDKSLPLSSLDYEGTVASYYWYEALRAIEHDQREAAIEFLKQACDNNRVSLAPNPDIVICLYRQVESAEDKAFFRTHFNEMVSKYRTDVADEEARLSQAVGPLNNAQLLAQYCNQLAWLLASCDSNVEEAIYLSQRSLEFDPEMHTYLDTMARCCFAAKRFEDAVEFQRQALAGSPNSRSMKAQLAEFELALANQGSTTKQDATGNE